MTDASIRDANGEAHCVGWPGEAETRAGVEERPGHSRRMQRTLEGEGKPGPTRSYRPCLEPYLQRHLQLGDLDRI